MIVACAAGLWVILRAGYGLQAPVDLSGAWSIGGEDPSVAKTLGETVNIEQSGQFVRLNFERGLHVDVKLTAIRPKDATANKMLDMNFESRAWKVTALGQNADGPLIFQLIGPEKHRFTATRVVAESGKLAETTPEKIPLTTPTADAGSDAP